MSQLLLHTRYQFLENLREPIAAVSSIAFPALLMLFFVVPNAAVARDPVGATLAAGQMAVFSVVVSYMFNIASGVAEDRDKPWEPYLRTLPSGPFARMGGRVLTAMAFSVLGMLPVIAVAALFTAAEATLPQVLAALLAVLPIGLPFLLMGMVIGYLLSLKAAIPVAQLTLFPLAFAGGLFMPPQTFPGWLDAISHALPTRAARDLVTGVLSSEGAVPASALPVLLGWTVLLAGLAVWAYRRDEGRRFR
ncbi:hypothetical protein GCM10009799_21930 [Nocardiopsis rhodophaea]|uniref:ABC-2 type transporter transmembrane domain-containing protein n=1 Tax=Nocardiopsis rhodophaea TaxID=280238 RepID=A0ABN2SZF3_9ACTN